MKTHSEDNKRIAKNSIFLYVRSVIVMLVSLYTSRVVLAALGFADHGLYNLVGSVVVMFNMFSATFVSSTQRFLNVALGQDDTEHDRAHLNQPDRQIDHHRHRESAWRKQGGDRPLLQHHRREPPQPQHRHEVGQQQSLGQQAAHRLSDRGEIIGLPNQLTTNPHHLYYEDNINHHRAEPAPSLCMGANHLP